MCLITLMKEGIAPLSNNKMRNSLSTNDDGTGIMFPNGDGTMTTEKVLGTPKEQLKLYTKYKNKNLLAVHNRYKTHGPIDEDNCHPFEVLNMAEHGVDMFMMHNGVIHKVPSTDRGKSDTWHFVECILKPIMESNPRKLGDPKCVLNDPRFQAFIEGTIGNSKLLFMDGFGGVLIINEDDGGYTDDGIWLSTPHYVEAKRSYVSRFPKNSIDRSKSYWNRKTYKWEPLPSEVAKQDTIEAASDDVTDGQYDNLDNWADASEDYSSQAGGSSSNVVAITDARDDKAKEESKEEDVEADKEGDKADDSTSRANSEREVAEAYVKAYGEDNDMEFEHDEDEASSSTEVTSKQDSVTSKEGDDTVEVSSPFRSTDTTGTVTGGDNNPSMFPDDGSMYTGGDVSPLSDSDYIDILSASILRCTVDGIEDLLYSEDMQIMSEAIHKAVN